MRPTVVLVHPGSLCDSFRSSWAFDADRHEQLLAEVDQWCRGRGARVGLVRGEFDGELATADRRLRHAIKSAEVSAVSEPFADDLAEVAKQLARALQLTAQDEILVTGAWAHPGDGSVTVIASELARILGNRNVQISAWAPSDAAVPVSFDIIASIERGADGQALSWLKAFEQSLPKSAATLQAESAAERISVIDVRANVFNVVGRLHPPAGVNLAAGCELVRSAGPFQDTTAAAAAWLALRQVHEVRNALLEERPQVPLSRLAVNEATSFHFDKSRQGTGQELTGYCHVRLADAQGPVLGVAKADGGGVVWEATGGRWDAQTEARIKPVALRAAQEAASSFSEHVDDEEEHPCCTA